MLELLGLRAIGLQLWAALSIDLSHLSNKKEQANKSKVSLLKKRHKVKELERHKKEKEEKIL